MSSEFNNPQFNKLNFVFRDLVCRKVTVKKSEGKMTQQRISVKVKIKGEKCQFEKRIYGKTSFKLYNFNVSCFVSV